MRAAGSTPQEIEAALGSRLTQHLEVWPENWPTWNAWLHLATQWRMIAGMAGVVHQGIEFASIPLALELAAVTPEERPAVLKGLREMERAALTVLNGGEAEEDI